MAWLWAGGEKGVGGWRGAAESDVGGGLGFGLVGFVDEKKFDGLVCGRDFCGWKVC